MTMRTVSYGEKACGIQQHDRQIGSYNNDGLSVHYGLPLQILHSDGLKAISRKYYRFTSVWQDRR